MKIKELLDIPLLKTFLYCRDSASNITDSSVNYGRQANCITKDLTIELLVRFAETRDLPLDPAEERGPSACAIEACHRLLQECNTTGVEVIKATANLAPKGGRGQ